MEGVTDAPMRALLTENPGFTHCVTEFLRVSQIALPKKVYPRHAVELRSGSRTQAGVPVIFQLLGGNAERLALSAARAVEMGAAGIDLNFGCPAPTVNSHDGGAAILRSPCRVEEIVGAVRKAVPAHIPVSAKLRLGWDDPNAIYENAARAEAGGAAWITIHGRTKMQGYTPPAYWGPIGEVIRQRSIPVIANGEIWTLADFHRCREETGAEHFMLGRGALANPRLAPQIAHALGILPDPSHAFPAQPEWQQLLHRFLELSDPLQGKNPHYSLRRVKQWMRYVAMKQPFAGFEEIKRLENPAELPSLIKRLHFPVVTP
jgi:tRNA-dihydrouridine synthase C